jgi:hypothetical protein
MQWVRRNICCGCWAALFALAVQFVVSFGHIHLKDLQVASPAVTTPLQPQANDADGTGPADDDRGGIRHRFCAICVAFNLTANSVLPTVSLLTNPVDRPQEWVADFRTTHVPFGLDFYFRARAPPPLIA